MKSQWRDLASIWANKLGARYSHQAGLGAYKPKIKAMLRSGRNMFRAKSDLGDERYFHSTLPHRPLRGTSRIHLGTIQLQIVADSDGFLQVCVDGHRLEHHTIADTLDRFKPEPGLPVLIDVAIDIPAARA